MEQMLFCAKEHLFFADLTMKTIKTWKNRFKI